MILINLSPQILGLHCTTAVFSIKPREKNDGWAGNCFGSVRSSFVTLLSHCVLFHRDRTWDSMLHVFIDL